MIASADEGALAVAAQDSHRTVLLQEAVDALAIQADGCYVDATFGRGGHSRLIPVSYTHLTLPTNREV